MSDDEFMTPSDLPGGGRITDEVGRLLLIHPVSIEKDISTQFGVTDAAKVCYVVLDGPEPGTLVTDALVFPSVLRGRCASALEAGGRVLGRLGRGTAQPGKSAPWILEDPTEADKNLARGWLAANAGRLPEHHVKDWAAANAKPLASAPAQVAPSAWEPVASDEPPF